MISKETQKRALWLDAIRAFAIVWVFFNHVAEKLFGTGSYFANPRDGWPVLDDRLEQIEPLNDGIWDVIWNPLRYFGWVGDTGVQLFLIASGFVLTQSLLRAQQRHAEDPTQPGELDQFARKRFTRLFPTFWVTVALILIVSIAVYAAGFGPDRYMVLPWTREFWLSLVGIRVDVGTLYWGSPSWWYVGLLVQLYLIFPILWGLLKRLGAGQFLWLVGGAMVAIRLAGLLLLNEFYPQYLDAWSRGAIVVTRLPELIFGMSLAWWATFRPASADLVFRTPAAYFGLLLFIDGFVASFYLVGNAVSPALLGVGSFLILTRLFRNFNDESRLSRWWLWLGEHSLALFLVNQHIIRVTVPTGTDSPITAMGGIVVAAVLTLAVGMAIDRITEEATELFDLWSTHGVARRYVGAIAGSALLVFGALVGLSVLMRGVEKHEIAGVGERPALTEDQALGWHFKPGTSVNVNFVGNDYTVVSNSDGFPGPELPTAGPGEDTLRVLVAGDSFSSATGVDTELSWPRLLQAELADATTDDVEVVNLSVAGWGPNQQAAALEQLAPDLKPDVIVVQASVDHFGSALLTEEALRDRIGFGTRGPNHPLRFVELQDMRAVIKNGFTDDIRERFQSTPNPLGWEYGGFVWLEEGRLERSGPEQEAVREAYERMHAVADELDAELVVLMIPTPVQVCNQAALDYFPEPLDLTSDRWDLDLPQDLVESITNDLDVAFHDLRPALGEGLCTYQPNNRYLLPRGHQLAAADIAVWLGDVLNVETELVFSE